MKIKPSMTSSITTKTVSTEQSVNPNATSAIQPLPAPPTSLPAKSVMGGIGEALKTPPQPVATGVNDNAERKSLLGKLDSVLHQTQPGDVAINDATKEPKRLGGIVSGLLNTPQPGDVQVNDNTKQRKSLSGALSGILHKPQPSDVQVNDNTRQKSLLSTAEKLLNDPKDDQMVTKRRKSTPIRG